MKKYILGLLTGIIIVGSIGVVAYQMNANQITYEPKDKSWKVTTVKEAVDDIKENGTVKKICKLKSGEALTVGSKYECNPNGDGQTKYNFFVLRVDSKTVKLIMERNITDTVGSAKTMNWNTAVNFFRNGAGKNLNWNVAVELPDAQDIAEAVGNTSWDMFTQNYEGWFCIGLKDKLSCGYGQNWQNATSEAIAAVKPYRYLFNYTRECTNFGCDESTSLDSNYAYGYWTRDLVINQTDSTVRAWKVFRHGDILSSVITESSQHGVRPVITINKNQIM